jgi:hypothetical protein
MIQEKGSKGNLWRTFCQDFVGGQLSIIWKEAVEKIGLNFLSLRREDQEHVR